jgi:hypothetical protein
MGIRKAKALLKKFASEGKYCGDKVLKSCRDRVRRCGSRGDIRRRAESAIAYHKERKLAITDKKARAARIRMVRQFKKQTKAVGGGSQYVVYTPGVQVGRDGPKSRAPVRL